MAFYNFPQISDRDSSYEIRSWRTSFAQKMRDAVYIFAGSTVFFTLNRGFGLSDKRLDEIEFGLIDYPLFPLKLVLLGLVKLMKINDRYNSHHRLAVIAQTILIVSFAILSFIHLSIAAVFAAVSSPFVGIAHLFSQKKASQLKKDLFDYDVSNQNVEGLYDLLDFYSPDSRSESKNGLRKIFVGVGYRPIYRFFSCEKLLESDLDYSIKGIRFTEATISINGNINKEIVKVVLLSPLNPQMITFKIDERMVPYLVFRDTPEGHAAFNALVELNLANYKNFKLNTTVLTEKSDIKPFPAINNYQSMMSVLGGLRSCSIQIESEANLQIEGQSNLPPLPADVVKKIAAFTCSYKDDQDFNRLESQAEEVAIKQGWKGVL